MVNNPHQELWRRRLHTERDLLQAMSAADRARFGSVWEPARLLTDMLRCLPAGLLRYWLSCNAGHCILTAGESRYLSGEREWQGQAYVGCCYINAAALLDGGTPWDAPLRLLDHLLGSRGEGACFSAGEGATPSLQHAADRFQLAWGLGYATEELAVDRANDYLIATWRLYLSDRQRLNTLDPLTERLLASTLMSERFWPQAG